MSEFLVEAIVLDSEDLGEADKRIHFYSKELGRFSAKAKSLRKITSKLAGHLEPLNFVKVRVIEKNGFQITDALLLRKILVSEETVRFAGFLREMIPELEPDPKIWALSEAGLLESGSKKPDLLPIICSMGFDPRFAKCSSCGGENLCFFSKTQHIFLCESCAFNFSVDGAERTPEDLVRIR